MKIPRIVIAGTHSGCGKTSVACGLMAALISRGLKVQPFKIGPDFIDTTHHTAICGRVSRNLDVYMMGDQGIIDTVAEASQGADIAVIEGVMGLYDGTDDSDTGSTGYVAKLLSAPTVLVIDTGSMSRSAAAVAEGYRVFDRKVPLAGIIMNRIGSDRHRELISGSLTLPALGWIPKRADIEVKGRHLGLRMAGEDSGMARLGDLIQESCDLEALVKLARSAPPIEASCPKREPVTSAEARIGIASDPAFCFYYRDNLERLARAGGELIFFSPMEDSLPDVDAIYLGGGYPELYADRLEASGCRQRIRQAIDDGMPVYAECGGLMYLTRSIVTDREYQMAGALPASAIMTKKLQALNYVEAVATESTPFLEAGRAVRGHEFHYSTVSCDADSKFSYMLNRGKGIADGRDGMYVHSAIGCYTHAYFSDALASGIVAAARRYRRS